MTRPPTFAPTPRGSGRPAPNPTRPAPGPDPHLTWVITVAGVPAPQGSKTVMRGRLVESSRKVGPWRDAVAAAVLTARPHTATPWAAPHTPVALAVEFVMPRRARTSRPTSKPDLDKLVRSTCDALTTARAIHDDAQILDIRAVKRLAGVGEPTGAIIHLTQLETP